RIDITDMKLVTIDGEDSRDFDDAVFAEPTNKGWKLVVAIADVSHYVIEGSDLDNDAIDRGNSVYFPRRVVPMLPEALSNG
ncbi:MAG TPA: ribonuclease R, partial [Gammaproteobacteria bacterium]|nr:ribonuclease R [Gammaproteobacteria bacterium]